MCICINCMYVNSCLTYQKIMKQHSFQRTKPEIKFNPSQPIISVNIYYTNESMEVDWDIIECLSFLDSPGRWIES